MLEHLRGGWRRVITPVAKGLLKLGITADMVTWFGTVLACLVAVIGFSMGWLWQSALILGALVLSDSIDGQMARISNTSSKWGAFLDSTLDRISDGAIFTGIVLWYSGTGDSALWAGIAVGALVMGQVTSYTKARGESVGFEVNGGIVTRADRLLLVLLGALLTGFGVELALPIALCLLLAGGTVTVGQRMWIVKKACTSEDLSLSKPSSTEDLSLSEPSSSEEIILKKSVPNES